MEQKRRKHTYSDRLRYMHMIKEGHSFWSIHVKYGINANMLKVLWQKYQNHGPQSLKQHVYIRPNYELKRQIVLDIEENHITLQAASLKYGPNPNSIERWLSQARSHGIESLSIEKKRGRQSCMGRQKKQPLTELEKFQKENQELKTQIALLKKVRALVEERNARPREIGQEPSKD